MDEPGGTKFVCRPALKAAARFWFVVAVIRQFAFTVAFFYGFTALRGNLQKWNKFLLRGYGAGAIVSADNAMVLGGAQGSAAAVNVGIGTATPLSPLDVRGNASITGNLNVVGTLSKGAGTFKIDHPLDPANKYLYHSFVESPDMMNVYNGNISTDGSGLATVTLPDWFEALNRDFRYQLTVIGQFAQAIVASEVSHHQFTIRTDNPNVKVSGR